MKKRGLEEEVQILVAKFETVTEFLTPKQAAPVLKQLELIHKRIRPKRYVKNDVSKNQNSGLLKPVEVSAEIAKFAGWEEKELHSRVDVTKVICEYIRKHDLQKPTNKKNILPDDVLKKLLRWDEDKEGLIIKVIDVLFAADEDSITVVIDTPPVHNLKPLNYYNGSELYTSEGLFAAVIKKIKLVEIPDQQTLSRTDSEHQDHIKKEALTIEHTSCASDAAPDVESANEDLRQYHIILDKIQEKIEPSVKLILKVPLTYPKIQARISTHLVEVIKQKKTKPKKLPPHSTEDPAVGLSETQNGPVVKRRGDGGAKTQGRSGEEPIVKNRLSKKEKQPRISQPTGLPPQSVDRLDDKTVSKNKTKKTSSPAQNVEELKEDKEITRGCQGDTAS